MIRPTGGPGTGPTAWAGGDGNAWWVACGNTGKAGLRNRAPVRWRPQPVPVHPEEACLAKHPQPGSGLAGGGPAAGVKAMAVP